MAFAATRAPSGFQPYDTVPAGHIFLVPGGVNTAFTKDNMLVYSAGLLVKSSDSSAAPLASTAKAVTTPAAGTSGFPKFGPTRADYIQDDGNVANSLLPVTLTAGGAIRRFIVPMEGYIDDTIASAVSSTTFGLTTGAGADDRPNGALIYVYGGTGAGQWNIITDYDHTGGAAELLITVARKFETQLSTDSTVLILAGEAAANAGVGPFGGRVDSADHDAVDVDDGADDGDWMVCMSAPEIPQIIERGALLVAPYSQFV